MKIALFGASGTIGQRIANEALSRGHQVTAVTRNPAGLELKHPNLTVQTGDATDPAAVASLVTGFDAVISAIGPKPGDAAEYLTEVTHSLLTGLKRAGVSRLLVVGGAGSLEVAPGKLLLDGPDFHAAWKPIALAHRDSLEVYRKADLDWTYFSPAALIQPGKRTGTYRTGTDQLLVDASGKSEISAEDYAVALIDELEKPRFIRRRFTAAY